MLNKWFVNIWLNDVIKHYSENVKLSDCRYDVMQWKMSVYLRSNVFDKRW